MSSILNNYYSEPLLKGLKPYLDDEFDEDDMYREEYEGETDSLDDLDEYGDLIYPENWERHKQEILVFRQKMRHQQKQQRRFRKADQYELFPGKKQRQGSR